MKAFISDIHGNADALIQVLKDIDVQGVDDLICLGDIVGYGPEPEVCIDLVMERANVTILGNHDLALVQGPDGFNRIAAEAIRFTQLLMSSEVKETCGHIPALPCMHSGEGPKCCRVGREYRPERLEFIRNLPVGLTDGRLIYVHGTPLDPTFEYLMTDNTTGYQPERVRSMFRDMKWLAFCGHTHHPCAVSDRLEFHYPARDGARLQLREGLKYIVNVGSVGQPRDRDTRSCYVLFNEAAQTIEWRRIAYDVDSVVRKVKALCGLDTWCGDRLKRGL